MIWGLAIVLLVGVGIGFTLGLLFSFFSAFSFFSDERHGPEPLPPRLQPGWEGDSAMWHTVRPEEEWPFRTPPEVT